MRSGSLNYSASYEKVLLEISFAVTHSIALRTASKMKIWETEIIILGPWAKAKQMTNTNSSL